MTTSKFMLGEEKLLVQSYLETQSLDDLAREHGVYARFSTKNPRKFSLNYDQLEAKDSDPISQECRGLILETPVPVAKNVAVGSTTVLASPMKRFFNHGQGSAATVDFSDPETCFIEKVDGTMCLVYFDATLNDWCVATRSVPDADLFMDGFGEQTFTSLFWQTVKISYGYDKSDFCSDFLSNYATYCFELCTLDNMIVVRYEKPQIFLLAVKDTLTGEELDVDPTVEAFANRGVDIKEPTKYKLNSLQDMFDFVSSRNPSEHEGIVVRDENFNRVKVKNAGYLALSKIKDNVGKSRRAVMELILLEKEDDVYPLLNEQAKNIVLDLKSQLQQVIKMLDEEYLRIYSHDRKTFALAVQAGSGYIGPHMSRWGGKCSSAHDWIQKSKKNGEWSAGFLETLLEMCNKF